MGIDFWMCEGGFELLAPFRAERSSRDVKRLKTNLFGTVFGAGYFLRTSPWMCVRLILLDVWLWKWLRALRFRGRRVEGQRQ